MTIDYEAICIVLGMGLFFGLLGLIGDFSFGSFLVKGLGGTFLGFAGLPYFDSKKWAPQPLICAVLLSSAGIGLGISREHSGSAIALLGVAGLLCGYLSPYLAKYF